MEKQTRRNVKGITLMALVITVIVLLILSGIGVAMLSGDNGIINRSVNAKDSAAVKSEMRIVEVSSNSARGKNKYGLVEEEKLKNELKSTAGEGKTEVTPYDNGSHFLITFLDTNRVYEVDNEEGVKYLGALNDVVNTGILTANPKRDKTPTKEHRTIKISLKTINEIPDEDVEVYYTWVKKKTQEIETSDLKLIEEFKGDTNDRTIKSGTVSTGELEDDGKWYLYVEARIKDGETVTEYFGDYVVGEPVIVADMGFVRYDYEKNGGSGCNRSSDQVAYGTTVALKGSGSNTATRTGGWEFVGWTTDEYGTVPIDSVEVNEQNNNIVVYAIFKKNLTLKFYDASHGTNPVEKTTTIYNNNTTGKLSSSNVPSIGSYNGWTVGYWTPSTNPNGRRATDDNGNIVASGATNYYAIYTKEVTVEYNLNGGTGTNITSETGTAKVNSSDLNEVEGASIDLPDAEVTKTGYTFNGWNTKADGTGVHYDKNGVGKFAEEITLYAEWGANSYSIKFDKNSESATGTMSNLDMVYGTEKQLTQNAYSWTGYTFNGWNTKADGTGAHFTDKQSVNNLAISGTITIYAQWTPNTYTISYDYAGGTGGTNKPTSGTYDTDIQISNPTKTGYTFAGWTSSSSDGLGETAKTGTAANPSTEWTGTATKNTYFRNLTDTNNGTVKLTATWTAITYTVEYYQGNNSTTAGSTKFSTTSSHTYGTARALKTYSELGGTPPSGWTFAGWSTSQTGTSVSTVNSVSLTDGASVTNLTNTANGTVKLYAIFKRNILFKSGANAGTTNATKEQRYNPYKTTGYLTSVTSPSALTSITGWTKTGTGTGYRNSATAGAATVALNAAVTPVYNETNLTYYGVYTKVINVYSGVSKGTNNKQTQYLNTNGNIVSGISLEVPATIENWTAIGYRKDTDAKDKETAVTTSAVSITPAYSTSAISYYAVYSRTLTIKYNGNSPTSGSTDSTTKTVYLNTNSTTTSSQQVTLANNGFIKNGYAFSKWALGSTSGAQYTEGASYTAGLAYNASSFEVTMYAIWQDVYLRTSEIDPAETTAKFLYTKIERRKIKSIIFENSIAGHTVDGTTCFDVSSITNSKQVLLWITNTDSNGYYDIVIGQNGGVRANPDSSKLFSFVGYDTPLTINFTNFNTSNVTNMSRMFGGCGYMAMTSLNLGDNFNTSNVTNMSEMFSGCGHTAMTSLDLGDKFDTSSVTDMSYMFISCGFKTMISLDLGNKFDTSNVINMSNMFSKCGFTAMTSLDLGDKFDTSSVTDMSYMFISCGYKAMTSLDLGDNFNTSNVTNMRAMFSECGYTAMTSLYLGDNFNTSNVINMAGMFQYCGYTAMTSLDLGNKFDTSSVTDMHQMFSMCGYIAMISLELGEKFDTSRVTDMGNMFYYCGFTAMTSLDLGEKFDTSNVTNMYAMFSRCGYTAMTSLDLGDKFDTSNVTNMSYMFDLCSKLVTIYATDSFVTTNVTNGANMFTSDTKLVGGMGTRFDRNHIDQAYAHLDLGTTDPGYFTDKRTYYVEFDANGGTGTMARQVMTYGESSNLTSNAFTKAGYTFAGWNTKADGSGTSYTDGQSVLNLEDGWKKVKILYAQWTSSTYTVEYYQGNNSTTAGSTKFATTSSHTFGTAKALTTYATLGGTAPSGWTFAGWSTSQTGTSVSTVNSVSLTDGASVTNLTNTANGTVKLYAIFKRNIVFKSGSNAGTTNDTKEQRYNPYKTTGYITSVTSPSALTAITGWTNTGTGTGYRNDATAGAATIGFSASVTPAYNATALTYYGVYTKVINVYSGVSKGTNNSQTQYLNTNGNKVSSISLAVPAAIENWTAIGYRDDTTADDKETAVTTSAVSITPAYSTSAISYYAVYSRTLTIKYNGNEATSGSTESTTKAVYLNTNSTTTSSQQVTLANNGFIKNGYMFNKWAKGSTSGTKYSAGASYTARLAYNASSFEVTMYAIWQDVYLRTSEASTDGTEAKFLYTTIERRKIKSVTFANSIAGHTVDGTTCFDVSSISNSKQVLLWITNTDENGYVDIVIGQNGGVKANPNSYQLFSYVGYTPSTFTIDFTNFDTSSVTNMNNMFSYCGYTAMTSLDLGDNFDTSSVTTMYGMFYCCGKAMTSIDLGEKFDTSNVTDMHSMFASCGRTAMTSLDLGDKFDTSKVTDMWSMFSYCGYSAMTSLDLGDKFDTSKVTDMGNMFQYCGYTAMTSLDLGDKFDTSSVTKMARMFQCCGYKAMTSLDLGDNFDTLSTTNMESMFQECGYTAMTSLDLGNKFDTSSVTNMIDMFHSCGYKAMTILDLGDKFDTSKVENMCYMFCSCGYTSMTSLDLGDNFDTSNVTKMISMFEGCGYKAMTSLDLGEKFDTSNVTSMSLMFEECGHTAMTSLDLGDKFDTSSVTNIDSMFRGCGYTSMTSLDLGDNFDTLSTTNMASMFQECGYTSMTSLDLGNKFDTSKVTNMSHMFSHCGHTAMTSLDLGDKFDTSSVTNMDQMFYNCPNLVTIYATESFVTTNVTNGNNMFTYDTKLVGGMGTTFDSNHIDQAYAHLDLGTTNPGYFTDKRTYYVEFDANEGTGTMARQVMTYGESSNLTTNTFTRTGYIFAGWNTEEDGRGTSYTDGQSVLNLEDGWKKVKKLYAQWTANSYTISYDYAGGTGGTNKPTSGAYDTDVQISNPTKTGYTFAGWTSSSSDGLGENAKTGTAANPNTAWTGTATKNTYFKNLTDTKNGTVKLTATWTANTYTVEYYQGNNSTTAGSTKFSTTSSHTYGTAKALTTYATLGGTAPSGWTFAGWSTSETGTAVSTVNSVSLTDGASVTNLTSTANGTVKLYAIFKRSIVFKSGSNAGTTNATKEQRYNPYKTTGYITAVTSPSALTAITGWTKTGTGTGYRNNATAGAATLALNTAVTPAYNATALTYYGTYTKAINVYSGVSKGTNNSQTQYLNTNGNKVSSISLAVPTAIENWTAIGYRDDTTAGDKETAVTTSAVSVTPAYSTSAISYYAVYSRTLTISYNGNEATSGSTSSTTKTVYLNTNSTTTSSQQVTLANNGFSKNGYAFSKWAVGNTDGTQYAQGASYTPSPAIAYNASPFGVTMYAIWQDVYLRKSETSTSGTTAKFLNTTIERRKIKSISFANSIAGHTVDGTTCFDVSSVTNSGQVLLWITNTDSNGYYDIVIGQNGGVKANPDSSYLFSYVGYTPSTFTINFTNFINTANVTNMAYMFNRCGYTGMTNLNLGNNFDTSSVTNMSYMFSYCGYTALTSLNLGDKFDTSSVEDMNNMFYGCGSKAMTNLNLGNSFDTSSVENMSYMFYDCGSKVMTSLDLGDKFDTSNVTDMSGMFGHCGYTAMTSLDLGDKFDTSSVENMSYMFCDCGSKAMTSLDLGDKFDTSSVTDMSYMFSSCGDTAMTSLDLGDNFDTSSVTNMYSMFDGCGYTSMTSIDLGNKFNTSNVTTMYSMFRYCGYTAMTSLNLGDKFDTSNVTNMSFMFCNCGYTAMTSLDLGNKFNTSSVTNMSNMFSSCGYTAMTSLDLGDKFDTSNVTNMNSMFNSCGYTAMTSLDLGEKFNTSKVTDMRSMFMYCGQRAMTSLDLGDKFDTSSVTDMSNMFYNCQNLVTIYATDSFVTTSVTNGADMFTYDSKLVGGMGTTYSYSHIDKAYAHLDLGTTNPGYFTDKRTYYVEFDANDGTGTMARQVMTYGESSNLTTNTFTRTGYIFAGWNTEEDGRGTSYTDGQSVLNLEDGWKKVKKLYAQWIEKRAVFKTGSEVNAKMKQLAGNSSATSSTEDTNITEVRRASSIPSQYMIDSNIVSTDSNDSTQPSNTPIYMWYDSGIIYYYTEDLRPETNANASDMFKYLSNVTTIEVEELDTENTTNMGYMFLMCQNLTSLDVSNFDTSEVTIMTSMFSNCIALTNLDVSGFDTSKVEYMNYMFQKCQVLTSINVSGFDTISVRKMERMFDNCKLLTSIDVSGFDTSNVEDMAAMFNNCIALTSIDVSGFDTSKVKYIDGMFSNCQVLTSIDVSGFDTSNVEYMNSMFYKCQALTNIDVSEFDTSKVKNMNYMFKGCKLLTSIDVSGFDTSKVEYMNDMFNGCESLTSIDVSGFNTEKVKNMSYMFQYCKALTVLDISGFNTALVTDMSFMFNNCTNLKTIFADTGWTTAAVTTSGTQMFTGDTVLVGGFGTTFDSSKIDKTYARIDQGTTLPGYFTDIHTYYVEFDANGGTGTMDKQILFYGTSSNLTANAFKNIGYSFASWNTEPDGSGTSYTDGQSVLNLEDGQGKVKTLYAQWTTNNYKLKKVIGASNLIANGGLDNYTLVDAPSKNSNGVTHTWDKALNGVPGNTSKAYSMTSWQYTGTGANMGVVVPEIGYHAHMRIVNGNNVIRFKTNEAYEGQTGANVSGGVSVTPGTVYANRWLGMSQELTGTSMTSGATYVVTLDAYRVSGDQNITGGLYYATTSSNSEKAFNSGMYSFKPTKTGEWETFSWTFTLASNYANTINPSFYVYGYTGGTGELYVDNVKLERVTDTSYITKAYDSLYTTGDLNPVSRSGYSFNGWYSDARYTKRIDETDLFNTNAAVFEDVNTPNTSAYIYAKWEDAAKPVVTITRNSYKTFTWTATDNSSIAGYQITNSATEPSATGTGWTTSGTLNSGTYTIDVSSAKSYYVYVKDNDNNIGKASITSYMLTRSQGANSTLKTRADSSSSTTGTNITANTAMLKSTPIWASATASTGYTPTLKIGGVTKTASGTTATIGAATTVASTATVHKYTIVFNKNNSNASGTMANMSMTYGIAKNLTANAFAVTTSGITSKQVFNGWNTKADGSGTSYSNGQSVNNLTTTNGGTVNLYAQWVNANYSVSSPVKYTLTLAQAVSAANAGATIKVLQTNTDSSSVSISKTLTLDLNGNSVTKNSGGGIYVSSGTFTVNGGGTASMLYVTNDACIINQGSTSSIVVNKALIKSQYNGILYQSNCTGTLTINNAWIYTTTSNTGAIYLNKAGNVTITSSCIYAAYGVHATIGINGGVSTFTLQGTTKVGGGYNSNSTKNALIDISGSGTTTVNIIGKTIVMGGQYNTGALVTATARKAYIKVEGEAEVYALNGTCIRAYNSSSTIRLNTFGWIYAMGENAVVGYGVNLLSARLLSSSNRTVVENGSVKYTGISSSSTRGFYYMSSYTGKTEKQINRTWYYYYINWGKNGNSDEYDWTYGVNGSLVTSWKQIGSYWYYFKKSSENPTIYTNPSRYVDGEMVVGWVKLSGLWYYLAKSNQFSGYPEGSMLVSGTYSIDGKNYNFASDGHCTNP